MGPPDAAKPRRPLLALPLIICGLATLLLFFTFPLTLPHLRTLLLPPCGHVVLISAARHGSSWFLDSAEGCASAASFERLNLLSELWNDAQRGPVRDITPPAAAAYAARNHSLKVFPLAYRMRDELGEFLGAAAARRVPLFMLTRKLDAAYGSIVAAQESAEWNTNAADVSRREAVEGATDEGEGKAYAQRISRFFGNVREMLNERGIEWDEFDYDDVVRERTIVGARNGCSIRNCNF